MNDQLLTAVTDEARMRMIAAGMVAREKPCSGCDGAVPPSKHQYRRSYCSYGCYVRSQRRDYGRPPCKRCGSSYGQRRVRELCARCWDQIRHTDEIHDYPRLTRRAADVAEDWEELASLGLSKRDAAARLGMTYAAFERALLRHAARQRSLASA